MFKYKKYKIKFKKIPQWVSHDNYKVITDCALLDVLLKLQDRYDFKLISTKFDSPFDFSYIKIKCKKEDGCKIFAEYCSKLDGYIREVSF